MGPILSVYVDNFYARGERFERQVNKRRNTIFKDSYQKFYYFKLKETMYTKPHVLSDTAMNENGV